MKSPFPGMDPYLERRSRWAGIHNRFLAKAEDAVVAGLPAGYVTELEERLVIDDPDGGYYRADLSVWDERPEWEYGGDGGTAVAELADIAVKPVVKRLDRPLKEWYLNVYGERGELVCTVELLSWSNKDKGDDRDRFLRRRRDLMEGPGSYVEIDLLRGGHPMPDVRTPASDYRVMVSPAYRRPDFWVWPVSLRDRLPVIPVPLRPPDKPVPLDLRAVWDAVVEVGRYVPRCYGQSPEPPLTEEDAEWAAGLVSSETR